MIDVDVDTWQWILLCSTWIGPALYTYSVQRRMERLEKRHGLLMAVYDEAMSLITAETEKKFQQAEAFSYLTDPEKIRADMERSAEIVEMRNEGRVIKVREDAGPPAKIYTPQLRAKVPHPGYKTKQD